MTGSVTINEVTVTLRAPPTPYRHRNAPTGHRYLPKKQRDQAPIYRCWRTVPCPSTLKLRINRVIMTAFGNCGLTAHSGFAVSEAGENVVECAEMPLTAARPANSAGIESVGDRAKGREPGSLDRSSSRPGRNRQYPNCAAMRSAAVATARRRPPPGPATAAGRSSTRGAHGSLGTPRRRHIRGAVRHSKEIYCTRRS
jgi:hypothetical protein